MRKVHIVYFLSRNGGKVEQPHLLRVHHLHRNGVHLRDVKRWLSDVRGEDMPDSYAWSYKRRYRSGYVWQDLKDDDLITPFSDNEYVLKGSEIASKNDSSAAEEEAAVQVQMLSPKTPRRRSLRPEVCEGVSPKTPSPPDQESPGALCPPPPSASDTSDEPLERAADDPPWKQMQDRRSKFVEEEKLRAEAATGGGGGGSWWSGRRTSSLLRNLLSCGAVETSNSTLTVKRDMYTDSNSKHAAKFSSSTNSRQCGKALRPEKLHLHTKSCRGFEARERNSFDKRQ